MRVLTLVSDDPSEWFEKTTYREISATIARIAGKIVLVTETVNRVKLTQNLLNSSSRLDIEAQNLVINFIQNTPRQLLRKCSSVDAKIGLIGEQSFTFETEVDLVEQRFTDRNSLLEIANRDDFVGRSFGWLAKAASKAEIFDPYAASLLLNEREWPLTYLLGHPNLEIVIHTGMEKTKGDSFRDDIAGRSKEINEKWQSLLEVSRLESNVKSTILTYVRPLHDRWMNFYFEEGSLSISLQMGLIRFAEDPLREVTSLDAKPGSAIGRVRQGWQSANRSYKRNSWTGSNFVESAIVKVELD
jgi:hypothetical protein